MGGQDDGSEELGSGNDPDNLIKFEVDNEQLSDGEQLHAMTGKLSGGLQNVKFHKVTVWADKTTHKRPSLSMEEKKCLVTYTKVNGHEVWMLWDLGSTATGVMPAFAHIMNLRVFLLTNPHILQLGTIDS